MMYLMLVCVDKAIELPAEERATIGPEVDAWISAASDKLHPAILELDAAAASRACLAAA